MSNLVRGFVAGIKSGLRGGGGALTDLRLESPGALTAGLAGVRREISASDGALKLAGGGSDCCSSGTIAMRPIARATAAVKGIQRLLAFD